MSYAVSKRRICYPPEAEIGVSFSKCWLYRQHSYKEFGGSRGANFLRYHRHIRMRKILGMPFILRILIRPRHQYRAPLHQYRKNLEDLAVWAKVNEALEAPKPVAQIAAEALDHLWLLRTHTKQYRSRPAAPLATFLALSARYTCHAAENDTARRTSSKSLGGECCFLATVTTRTAASMIERKGRECSAHCMCRTLFEE